MRKVRTIPSQSELKSILDYNPDTGEFTRACDRGRWKKGESMGSVSADGYVNISIDGRIYRAHRIAWMFMTGQQPIAFIDHENRNRLDNRWSNLRSASQSENLQNSVVKKTSSLGLKGVTYVPSKGRYRARITSGNKTIFEQTYETPEEAKAARDAVAKVLHQRFFRS